MPTLLQTRERNPQYSALQHLCRHAPPAHRPGRSHHRFPCANRTEDTAELIGLFMNIQVMRLRLGRGVTFTQLLRKVQDWTLGAYENQELPFENLVHDPFFHAATSRSRSRSSSSIRSPSCSRIRSVISKLCPCVRKARAQFSRSMFCHRRSRRRRSQAAAGVQPTFVQVLNHSPLSRYVHRAARRRPARTRRPRGSAARPAAIRARDHAFTVERYCYRLPTIRSRLQLLSSSVQEPNPIALRSSATAPCGPASNSPGSPKRSPAC